MEELKEEVARLVSMLEYLLELPLGYFVPKALAARCEVSCLFLVVVSLGSLEMLSLSRTSMRFQPLWPDVIPNFGCCLAIHQCPMWC